MKISLLEKDYDGFGAIYKISNTVNEAVYIGQTIGPVYARFNRHMEAATTTRECTTHFSRAIKKYGATVFSYEIIDTAKTQDELTDKEYHWIKYHKAIGPIYNETEERLKSGGNTYRNKTKKEMEIIGAKIGKSLSGRNNGNARTIKVKNIKTGEVKVFETVDNCQHFFKLKHHNLVVRRCTNNERNLAGKTLVPTTLIDDLWMVAYDKDDFGEYAAYDIVKTYRKSLLRKFGRNDTRPIDVLIDGVVTHFKTVQKALLKLGIDRSVFFTKYKVRVRVRDHIVDTISE